MLDILLDFVFGLLQLALEAALPVLVVMLIAWVRVQVKAGFAKLEPNVQLILQEAARIAVLAAEQMNLAGQLDEKLDFAVGIAQSFLNEHGVELELDLIIAAIEAAVMDEFNRDKAFPPA